MFGIQALTVVIKALFWTFVVNVGLKSSKLSTTSFVCLHLGHWPCSSARIDSSRWSMTTVTSQWRQEERQSTNTWEASDSRDSKTLSGRLRPSAERAALRQARMMPTHPPTRQRRQIRRKQVQRRQIWQNRKRVSNRPTRHRKYKALSWAKHSLGANPRYLQFTVGIWIYANPVFWVPVSWGKVLEVLKPLPIR